MLIFLPPSEGKTSPAHDDGTRLDLSSLLLPELKELREQVLRALIRTSGRADAQQILKVGSKVMPEVHANERLTEAPAAPAWRIYTGVLFDALCADSLSPAQLHRARQQVHIFSGLFGATGFGDRIPAYRLSMDVALEPLGRLSTFWKKSLARPYAELVGNQLVVDCRSASYSNAFKAPATQTLAVNSFTLKDGQRKVVTHFAKHARGELTSMLLRAESEPKTIDDVVAVASQRWQVEVRESDGKRAHQLDLIG